MFDIGHRVRVFVFQVLREDVQFLLLQRKPISEWPPGPVIGTVRPEENLQDAIRRKVHEDTGLWQPSQVLDLQPSKELFGDIGLVDWAFAYQAGTPDQPVRDLRPGPAVEDWAWVDFPDAFAQLQEQDREALVRLQIFLQ